MKRGQRFKTQDGRIAFFITREDRLTMPLIFRVGDEIWTRQANGKHCDSCDGIVFPAIILKTKKQKMKEFRAQSKPSAHWK
jgi:hypothetical protein